MDDGTYIIITDGTGCPLAHVPRITSASPDAIERLGRTLRMLATVHTVRSLTKYQIHSPVPAHWFSVGLFNKNNPSENTASGGLHLAQGGGVQYIISNRTDDHSAHVHMLSLNASWTIGTLLWHVHLPPRQLRTGELSVVPASKVNDDDPPETDDTILVIFCVGEQCAERLVTASEWLRKVYIPPVLLEPGTDTQEGAVWPFFVPPPNWLVKHFTIRTVQQPRGGPEEAA